MSDFKKVNYAGSIKELRQEGNEKDFQEFMKFENSETSINDITPVRCPTREEILENE
jgi:hypothetical protein